MAKAKKPARRRDKGSGSVYRRAGCRTWTIRWTEVNGIVRRKGGFPDEGTAKDVLTVIVGNVRAGKHGMAIDAPPAQRLSLHAEAWIERRKTTHRSWDEDKWRWAKHLGPAFGHLTPDEVDPARLRSFIEDRLKNGKAPGEGLSSSTVRLCILTLSGLFSDLVERQLATRNPVRDLPRATRRLIRPSHDPRTTPFLQRVEDMRRVFVALPEPINIAFALGGFAGLRPGEVLALRWENVDLPTRRIHVRESIEGPLKDEDSRVAPILDALLPVLVAWHANTGGTTGRVVRSMRSDGEGVDEHTLRAYLDEALDELGLERITWYQATRHSMASHWVMSGGTLEKLREILGHSTVQVTERYSHLLVALFTDDDLSKIKVNLIGHSDGSSAVGGAQVTDKVQLTRKHLRKRGPRTKPNKQK